MPEVERPKFCKDAKQTERSLKGKDVVLSEGVLSFCNGCENEKVRCNGRGKPLALRKANGIVQMRSQKA